MDAHIDLSLFRGAVMFEESLVESTPLLRSRNRWPVVAALTVQTTIVSALIAIPLLRPESLLLRAPALEALTLPPMLLPPPPKPRLTVVTTTSSAPVAPSAPAMSASQLPVIHSSGTPVEAPLLAVGTSMSSDSTNPLDIFGTGDPATAHSIVSGPASQPAATLTGKRVTISTGVSAGLLLGQIQPEYPAIAKISRTEGVVVIQAIISKSGRIESARVLSGPIMLQASALQAVRSARYRPYLLNNEPTEVETTITINFRLAS
jgi:protein TonB